MTRLARSLVFCLTSALFFILLTSSAAELFAQSRPVASVMDQSSPLSDRLVGLYLMNEGSGTTTKNLVNGQTANFSGTASPTWNTNDPSVVFNGGSSLNSYIDTGVDTGFDHLTTNRMTVVAKVWVNAVTNAGVCENMTSDRLSGFVFGWNSSGALRFQVGQNSSEVTSAQSPANTITTGQWIQVAATWDGTVNSGSSAYVHLFLNGVELTKASVNSYVNVPKDLVSQTLRIGNASVDFPGALNGKMAYLAIYKGRILSPTEMTQLGSQLPITDPSFATATTAPNGLATTVTTSTPGQKIKVGLSATTGQQATINFTGNTLGNVDATLVAPDGSTVSSTASSQTNFSLSQVTLAASGIYTVLITPAGNTTGSISVRASLTGGTLAVRPTDGVIDASSSLSSNLVGLFLMNEGAGTTTKNQVNGRTASFAGAIPPFGIESTHRLCSTAAHQRIAIWMPVWTRALIT